MRDIVKIEIYYLKISTPENVTKGMSKSQFKEWLKLGSVEDIEACLPVFEDWHMWEHCSIIRDLLNEIKS